MLYAPPPSQLPNPTLAPIAASLRANVSLSREHSIVLLQKLATDDGFRSRYEADPAAALAETGVPQAVIDALNATSKAPMRLAAKATFAAALDHYRQGVAEVCLCQVVPMVSLSIGAQAVGAPASIPFAAS